MKKLISSLFTKLALALAASATLLAAPTATQQIALRPGWNAIWLEVAPVDPSPTAVFNGAPIDSVWGWSTPVTSAEFVDDPAAPNWNTSAMLMFVPTDRVESFQNNLFAMHAHRPYLVKLLGGSAVTITVTGTPSAIFPAWLPNVFNLRGFPVDPSSPPTFAQFFQHSAAHYASGQIRQMYQLAATGQWQLVSNTTQMENGVAYWVRCEGASTYAAPVEVTVPGGDELDFTLEHTELTIELKNNRGANSTATISGLEIGAGAMSRVTSDPEDGLIYTPITGNISQVVTARATFGLPVRINRALLPTDTFETVATIVDGLGTRLRLPVAVQRITAGTDSDPAFREAKTRAGLWVGTVTLTGVSEAHSGPLVSMLVTNQSGLVHEELVRVGAGEIPTPTAQDFRLRLLLHVDTNGVTRLLKEVTHMVAAASFTTDGDGVREVDVPARDVLVTDETLIPQFGGVRVVDGKAIGRRLSTADYDFPSTSATKFLNLTGYFATSNTVSGTITLSPNLPTNPFRHKYHPDHDNLAADFRSVAAREEVYEVTRAIELMITEQDPSGKTPPGYGDEVIGGTYKETVSGLHRVNIVTSGTFSLRRMSRVGVLNR